MSDSEIRYDWAAIRAEYEAKDAPVSAIIGKYGVSKSRLYARARAERWPQRLTFDRTRRSAVIARMKALLEKQLRYLEDNVSGMGEKEITQLGAMTRTMEKLMELERAAGEEKPKRPSRELQALRKKLAARIDALQGR